MKILVCAKVINGEINPFDQSAIECALNLSQDVTVITMGPKSAENALSMLTRLGVKAILISDMLFSGSDTLATSYVLHKAISICEYDLILCGRQSIDSDTAQVGPMLSYMLGIELITNALSIEVSDNKVIANTRTGKEQKTLPAIVTLERGYVLRFPSIFSKPKEVTILNNGVLGCDPEKCGLNGSPTRVLKTYENTTGKRKCKFISFDELKFLVPKLLSEDKQTINITKNTKKFESVWAVGDQSAKKAEEIAEKVIVIDPLEPEKIIQKAIKLKPKVILWNADYWGRKTAPIVAAALSTGLCADCTSLETDGETLFMYRPAQSGNIIAKIKCTSFPQMATVRTEQESASIIVSAGNGVAQKMNKVKQFALSLNAELLASRGLVNSIGFPYERQVGLTGKTVSPKIYIAIGISGAIHHTCAIEGAKTVIAINSDRNARIFDYADYGIIEEF